MVNKIQCEFCLFDHKVCHGNGTGRCSTCIARGRARCIYPPGRPSRIDFAAHMAATGGRQAWKQRDAAIQAAAVAAVPVAAGGGGVAAAAPMIGAPYQGAPGGGMQNQGGSSTARDNTNANAAPASGRAPATTTSTHQPAAPLSQNQNQQQRQQQQPPPNNAASSPRSPFNPGSPEPYRSRQASPLRSPSQIQPSHESFDEAMGAIQASERADREKQDRVRRGER